MIIVLLAQGFEEIEAIVPIDILRRADIAVTIFGIGSKLVYGGHGIAIECNDVLADSSVDGFLDDIDGVIVPGGHEGALNIAGSSECCNLITTLYGLGKMIAAICAAPALVLEPLDVLADKNFTCYPTYNDNVSSGQYHNSPVVVDDNIITAQAAGSALQFAQQIVAYIKSQAVALHTMQKIYFTPL